MPCEALTFNNLTQEQYAALVKQLNAAMRDQGTTGAGMSDLTGTAAHSGVTITWTYDPASSTLTITCTKKPFYVSCDYVADKIRGMLVDALTGGNQ